MSQFLSTNSRSECGKAYCNKCAEDNATIKKLVVCAEVASGATLWTAAFITGFSVYKSVVWHTDHYLGKDFPFT